MKMRFALRLFCFAFILAAIPGLQFAGATPAQDPAPTAAQLQTVVSGLDRPVYLTNARDGRNRLFIIERPGIIKVLQPGATTPSVFLNITSKVLFSGSEQGLLGLAFHPNYSVNGRFFVNYTRQPDGATVIAEYHVSPDPDIALTTEIILLTVAQPFSNHNGGMLEFGPDGFLYIALGDGGSANDPGNRAQNINDLLGKILRINIDTPNGPIPYSSPPSNPFFGPTAGLDEIYLFGMRNPWRFSFDRANGQLFIGDVGQGAREEIDIGVLGGNYGWRIMEGSICNPNFNGGACTPPPNHIGPVTEYSHAGGRCSVTGGYVYRGGLGSLPTGTYVFADFCTGEIFTLVGSTQSLLLDSSLLISSFGEDEAGEIYVAHLSNSPNGSISRITGMPPPAPCAYSVSPPGASFGTNGGSGGFTLTTSSGCNWIAASNAEWLDITSNTRGGGSTTINFTVASNTTGGQRVGEIHVGGATFSVVQSGANCAFSISPAGQSYNSAGGSGNVMVSAPAGCNWSATSNASFITIVSGTPGSGNGSVAFSVAPNPDPSPRSGTMTVAGQTFTVNQSGNNPCSFSISPTREVFASNGGSSVLSVNTAPGCNWMAVSNNGFIRIIGAASGSGSASVSYSVDPNASQSIRTGTITVEDQVLTVVQAGTSCVTSITPVSSSIAASGGAALINISAPTGCNWTATSLDGFITLGTMSGSGAGRIKFNVSSNQSTNSRVGKVIVGGRVHTVNQAGQGCTFSISPTSQAFGSGGGTGTVSVSTGQGCNWTAMSNASFIMITGVQGGSGNGTVDFSVAPNTGASLRSGTMTIAGRTFTVNQAGTGGGCIFSISPTSRSFGPTGGGSTVAVSAPAGCNWSATSNASFITIVSGTPGSGNGSVAFSVAPNPDPSPRSGTMTVAGQTFTVNQSGNNPCSFSISPTGKSFANTGGTSSVTVTATSGCDWTATSNAPWITIISGANGSGSGSVTYSVAQNATGVTRTGTLTIAGKIFTVKQQP